MFMVIIISLFTSIYVLCRIRYRYWTKRNIPCPKPTFLFGHSLRYLLAEETYHDCLKRLYDSTPGERYIGGFEGLNPVLIVRDPSAVVDITITDHAHFNARYVPWFARAFDVENLNPLSSMLFFQEGNRWKRLRQKLIRWFSSSKSKKVLLDHAVKCAAPLETVIGKSKEVDMQDLCLRYVIDIVGFWIFGIECETLMGKSSAFVDNARSIFDNNNLLRFLLYAIHPKLLDLFRMRDFREKNCKFVIDLIHANIWYRKKNNIRVDDLLDTLTDIVDESGKETDPKLRFNEFTIYGGTFGSVVASYETTAKTLFYVFYELAMNTDIQDEVRDEISTVTKQHDGKVDLDMLKDLKYLDMVLAETSRKYPGDGAIFRQCTRDYVIPGTSSRIEAGTVVLIPTYGFHHDPMFYPNPGKFDPQRFSSKNVVAIPSGAYLGFGKGHRICPAMKSAHIMMKVACIEILSKYRLSLSTKTPPGMLSFTKGVVILTPADKVYVNLERLE